MDTKKLKQDIIQYYHNKLTLEELMHSLMSNQAKYEQATRLPTQKAKALRAADIQEQLLKDQALVEHKTKTHEALATELKRQLRLQGFMDYRQFSARYDAEVLICAALTSDDEIALTFRPISNDD